MAPPFYPWFCGKSSMTVLPARVVVIGISGSGKSTLAAALARILDCPQVELDSLYWGPHWTERSEDEFRALICTAVAGDTLGGRWQLPRRARHRVAAGRGGRYGSTIRSRPCCGACLSGRCSAWPRTRSCGAATGNPLRGPSCRAIPSCCGSSPLIIGDDASMLRSGPAELLRNRVDRASPPH